MGIRHLATLLPIVAPLAHSRGHPALGRTRGLRNLQAEPGEVHWRRQRQPRPDATAESTADATADAAEPETTISAPGNEPDKCDIWIEKLFASDENDSGGLSVSEYYDFLSGIEDPPYIAEYFKAYGRFEDLPLAFKSVKNELLCHCRKLGFGGECCKGSDAEIRLEGLEDDGKGGTVSNRTAAVYGYRDIICPVLTNSIPSPAPKDEPSINPTKSPSPGPTASPSTAAPVPAVTGSPTRAPSIGPSAAPVTLETGSPTLAPVTGSVPTDEPSINLTKSPSPGPTTSPSTAAPVTGSPTRAPSMGPSAVPSTLVTGSPSPAPVTGSSPTDESFITSTRSPSAGPTATPTARSMTSPTPPPSTENPSPLGLIIGSSSAVVLIIALPICCMRRRAAPLSSPTVSDEETPQVGEGEDAGKSSSPLMTTEGNRPSEQAPPASAPAGTLGGRAPATGGKGESAQAAPFPTHRAFASLRFGPDGAKKEARLLKEALAPHGVELFVVAPRAGQNITKAVFSAIKESELFIVLATKSYGEDTNNPACTFQEINFWRKYMAKKFPDRLIPIDMRKPGQEHLYHDAQILFSSNEVYEVWPLGEPMPPNIVDNILEVLNN